MDHNDTPRRERGDSETDRDVPLRVRRGRLLAFYAACCVPLIVYGASQALQTNSNSPLTWVPPSFLPRARYDDFVARFGTGEVVVASWPGCTLDEPALDDLVASLRNDAEFRDADGEPYFERITCGREIVERLTSGQAPLPRRRAVARFRGSLIGNEGRQTCLVVAFTPAALNDRARLVTAMTRCIRERCAVAEDDIHLAGPVIDGLSVDRAGRASLDRLALPSAGLMFLLACLCLRSLRDGAIVFGLSLFCQGATLALVHYSGESMNALLIVLPPLIQVLAIAGGVHLTNYYHDSLPHHGPDEAPWQAVRMGWLPCLLSSGTTALGIGSLMTSQLTPIRTFGMFGFAGVLSIFGLLLMAVPAVWVSWPKRLRENRDRPPTAPPRRDLSAAMTAFVARRWPVVLAAGFAAMFGSGFFLKDLKTSVRIETLFPEESRVLRDCRWIEDRVAPLAAIDVIVSWPARPAPDDTRNVPDGADDRGRHRSLHEPLLADEAPSSVTERLKRLWEIQKAIAAVDEVGGSVSALQFFPPLPPRPAASGAVPAALRARVSLRTVFDRTLERILDAQRPAFADLGFLAEEDGRQHWRISARVGTTLDTDYREILQRLRDAVAPQVAADPEADRIDVRYTGVMPLVHAVQRRLMSDLLRSFLGALAVITIVLTLSQGGLVAGVVAMIPNVFPIVVLFGALGWWGMPLDIGTVMTASVALGIAVDDTLHFLTFFQQASRDGQSRQGSVRFAYRHCAKAMVQTSVICGLGLLVFGFSEFVPTSRFAWLMSTLIGLALVGDLCFLPAILLSPLGRYLASESASKL